MGKKKVPVKKVIAAIMECGGILQDAATTLGIARSTLHGYRKDFPEIEKAVHAARQELIDDSFQVLREDVRTNRSIESAKWVLATLGKGEGFTSGMELSGPNGGEIKFTVEKRIIDCREHLKKD